MKWFILTVLLVGCGRVTEELNPTYAVKVTNPQGVILTCLQTVDGESKTVETKEAEIHLTSNRANEWIYLSCQKKEKNTAEVKAFFLRNDSPQETDECATEFCIVTASGVTK